MSRVWAEDILGESDEVLVVGVHVGQLDVYQQQNLDGERKDNHEVCVYMRATNQDKVCVCHSVGWNCVRVYILVYVSVWVWVCVCLKSVFKVFKVYVCV